MQPVFVILISRRKEQQIIRKAQKLFHITICISLSRIQSPSKKKQKIAGQPSTSCMITQQAGTTLFDITICIVAKLK
jgi:hypothetical protein